MEQIQERAAYRLCAAGEMGFESVPCACDRPQQSACVYVCDLSTAAWSAIWMKCRLPGSVRGCRSNQAGRVLCLRRLGYGDRIVCKKRWMKMEVWQLSDPGPACREGTSALPMCVCDLGKVVAPALAVQGYQ